MPDEVIAILGMMLVFGIPIIAILTHHQRKMAELIHQKKNEVTPDMGAALHGIAEEVRQMRQELHNQAIAVDDLKDRVERSELAQNTGQTPAVEDRMTQEN